MAKISLSVDELNNIVTKINTSSQKISELWNSVKTTEITKIRESWMGKDCEAYIVKVEQMDVTMQQAIKALQLLGATYKQAIDDIVATQKKITNDIQGL